MSTVPKVPNSPQETNFSPPDADPNERVLTARLKLYEAREQLDSHLAQLNITNEQYVTIQRYMEDVSFWENTLACWEIIAEVKGVSHV